MDIRECLLEEHSKAQTIQIVELIGGSRKRFAELMAHVYSNEKTVTQRAAWVMFHATDARPELIRPYLPELIENLRNPVHDAVKRNTLKILEVTDLSDELLGPATDLCFGFLADPAEPAAVRAHSMTICLHICQKEPALADELRMIIENGLPQGGGAFKSRARKVLKALEKLCGS